MQEKLENVKSNTNINIGHISLSRFYPDFILIQSRFYRKDTLSKSYPDFCSNFIQIVFKFYPDFISFHICSIWLIMRIFNLEIIDTSYFSSAK